MENECSAEWSESAFEEKTRCNVNIRVTRTSRRHPREFASVHNMIRTASPTLIYQSERKSSARFNKEIIREYFILEKQHQHAQITALKVNLGAVWME